MQCGGNGVDWQAGNTLRISDSVIQGYAQYGVRAGVRRGGYGGFELANVYEEVGACANPMGRFGQAGVIAQGSTVKIHATTARQRATIAITVVGLRVTRRCGGFMRLNLLAGFPEPDAAILGSAATAGLLVTASLRPSQ